MLLNILAPIISLVVTPQTCLVPCQVQVKVKIENAIESDKARLVISDIASTDLVVETGKRTYVLPNSRGFYTIHETGEFEVTASLVRRGEKPASASATIIVSGGEQQWQK